MGSDWTQQWLQNTLLATEAGIYGQWYYGGPGASLKGAGRASFRRAITYSSGSIAFGSLIVALLDLLRAGLNILRSQAQADGDMLGAACACVAQCCVGCIAWAVEFFNRCAGRRSLLRARLTVSQMCT